MDMTEVLRLFGMAPGDDLTRQYSHSFDIDKSCDCQISRLSFSLDDDGHLVQSADVRIDPACETHSVLLPPDFSH
jgi:hypothetical protein